VSSVAETAIASGTFTSVVETYIPFSQKRPMIPANYTLNSKDFRRPQATTPLQDNRVQPKLGNLVISLHMDMRRFAPISRIEKESIGTISQYGWHSPNKSFRFISNRTRDKVEPVSINWSRRPTRPAPAAAATRSDWLPEPGCSVTGHPPASTWRSPAGLPGVSPVPAAGVACPVP